MDIIQIKMDDHSIREQQFIYPTLRDVASFLFGTAYAHAIAVLHSQGFHTLDIPDTR